MKVKQAEPWKNRPAAVWKRILAFLVDLYLVLAVCASFLAVVQGQLPQNFASAVEGGLAPTLLAAIIYASIFIFVYHVFCEYIVGQTLGMLIFHVHVTPLQARKDQSLPRLWQAVVRNLFLIPFFPFTILWVVEPLYYVFQGERLLEHWSRTTTVE